MEKESKLQINGQRLWRNLEELAQISEPDRPWTRLAFDDLYLQGRKWLRQRFLDASAEIHFDAAANLSGRWGAPSKPRVMIGSHTDTVHSGGRFDGTLGVLAALEVAQSIAEAGLVLPYSLEVMDFFNEEPNDYGLTCVGSSALAGTLTPQQLAFCNQSGETLAAGMARMGAKPELLSGPLASPPAYFLECHIEQGAVLEQLGADIGVVSTIVGITRVRIKFGGQSNHAGTTPMTRRHDALLVAGDFHRRLTERARSLNQGADYLVATVGRFNLKPNAANIVPGEVELVVDLRSNNRSLQLEFIDWLQNSADECARQQGCRLEQWTITTDSLPVDCDPGLQRCYSRACALEGYRHHSLVSGAGHDCAYLASFCPSAMIFIPSRDGVSHAPEEWSAPEQVAKGCQVLARTLILLAEDA